MKTASAWLIVGEKGSNVQKHNLTPAEVQLLCTTHFKIAGKVPVHDLTNVQEVKRTNREEWLRLKSIYPAKLVESLFGKLNPSGMPESFEDALASNQVEIEGANAPAAVIPPEKPTPPPAPPKK